jgi:hypothetical protein
VRFDPDEWGTVAEWVAAIGTAGALGAAVGVLRIEQRTRLSREAAETAAAERGELERATSLRVRVQSTKSSPGVSHDVEVEVWNEAVNDVFFDVRVWPMARTIHDDLSEFLRTVDTVRHGSVGPGERLRTRRVVPWQEDVDVWACNALWRDARGRWWRMNDFGAVEASEPPLDASTGAG